MTSTAVIAMSDESDSEQFLAMISHELRTPTTAIIGWAEVNVSDQGRGISPDFLPHVFDPFRQGGDRSLNRQGLGLGLAIARQIVVRHGGGIHAVSGGEGTGATFTVRLRRTGEASAV